MSTWGLSGTTPFLDFAEDPEDSIYKYLGGNWALTTPTHINKLSLFQTTNTAQMVNRPIPGNRPLWLWVMHYGLNSARNQGRSGLGRSGAVGHLHTFDIHLFTNRLTQGLTFPDLGKLAREVERLIYQYANGQITGIQQFNSFDMLPIAESSDMGEPFAGMYRATCRVVAQYEKESTF